MRDWESGIGEGTCGLGYCVSTIGLDEEQIRKYVRWQNHKDKQAEQLGLWQ